MTAALALALLLYFPHLKPPEARTYARIIVEESRAAGVDPLLTAARTWCESGFRVRAYRAGTYGLMQTRLKTFNPRKNISEGVRVLALWQRWHKRGRCKQLPAHNPWAHYTWGVIVPLRHRTLKGRKMDRVMRLLKRACSKMEPTGGGS